MAERRMFSKRIISTARFLKMPVSTQCLYFHLGLNADDDGIVEAYTVMNSIGATEDDLKILVAKHFVVVLNEDLVTFILDWKENNKLRADRKVDSIYKDLLLQVVPDVDLLKKKQRADLRKKEPEQLQITDGQPTDDNWTSTGRPLDSIGKDRIGKDSIGKDSIDNNKSGTKVPDAYIIDLPTNRFNTLKENYYVTDDFYKTMVELYPNVNVLSELKKMKAWLITNKTKRKTLNGMEKFINNWLSNNQNGGHKSVGGNANVTTNRQTAGSIYAGLEN